MSHRKLFKNIGGISSCTVLGWFVVAFIVLPVLGVLFATFFSEGDFSLSVFKTLFTSKRVLSSLSNTYIMTFCTIITVNILGIFQVMVTEYFDIKFTKFLNIAFMTSLVYGSVALVTGYNFVYSANGIITQTLLKIFPTLNPYWFTGFAGVLFVHSFAFTGNHMLFVKSAFKRIDYSTIEASKSLGASDVKAFTSVALPIVMPSLFTATILVALSSLNSFAAPVLLGGKNFYMINSMIKNLNGIGSRDLAALLSIILALSCIVLLTIFRNIEKKSNYLSVSKVAMKMQKVKIKKPIVNIIIHILAFLLAFIYLLPIAAIILYSFADFDSIINQTMPNFLTFSNYIRVFSQGQAFSPLLNSILLSGIAVGIVLVVCIVSSLIIHKKKGSLVNVLEYTLLIPWMIPATLLAVGLITVYAQPNILVFNKTLLGGFMLLPIAYAVMKIPSAMRLMRSSLFLINKSHEEASQSLGAGVFKTFWKVVMPIMLPTIIAVAVITFNGLLSEYTMTALLYNIKNVPLGIAIASPTHMPDPFAAANQLVYICMLIFISAMTLILTRKTMNK